MFRQLLPQTESLFNEIRSFPGDDFRDALPLERREIHPTRHIKKVLDRPDNHKVISRKIKTLLQALMEGEYA